MFKKPLAAACMMFAAGAYAGPLTDSVKIPYETFTLDNGLRVVVHTDRKAPVVAVNVWYHVGSKDEKPGKTGFAHLFEHLMFNGSENAPGEFFEPFEKAGATGMNGTTWLDRTNYFETVPTPALDMALWMESDRMGHMLGAIDQAKLDEQRGVVQNEKRQGENQPYGKSWEMIQEAAFPEGHPYSWSTIGSMEDLNAASLEDVKAWFHEYYGASNAVVVLAGDIDVETAKAKAEKYFGFVSPGEPLDRPKAWVAKRTEQKRVQTQDRVPQARLYKSWNTAELANSDSDVMQIVAELLAGGKNSRLYKRLVHEDQIATSVSVAYWPFELASLFTLVADAKPGVELAQVEQVIDEEIARFLKKGPDKKELERVRTSLFASFVRGSEKVGGWGGKSDILASNAVYMDDPGAFKKSLLTMEEATTKDVQKVAKRWLSEGDLVLEVTPFPKLAASGKDADRSKIPDAGDVPQLSFPAIERTELANGLNVVYARRDTVPQVNMSLMFDAGYAADFGSKLGITKFTSSVMLEGTKKRDALEIAEQLEALGAVWSVNNNVDVTSFNVSALTVNLRDTLDVYADILQNPAFRKGDVERKRALTLAGIAQEKSQPVSMALRTLPPLLYGDQHAYGIPLTGSGTEASVNSISIDDMKQFHARWIRPDNATLVAVGAMSMEELKPELERAFGKWKAPSADKGAKQMQSVQPPAKASVYLIDKPGAEQSIIFAGQLVGSAKSADNLALDMANTILGGAFTARLNMNLREDKHWAYGAYTFMVDAVAQQPLMAYAPVQTDKTKESVQEVARELQEYLGKNPAQAEELQRYQLNEVAKLPGSYETMNAVLGAMSSQVRFDRPDDYVVTYADRVKALTVDQVRQVAKTNMTPDKLTWVIVGDLSKIEAGIKSLNLGDIKVLDVDGNAVR
ncbi:M16 family metallopeptidase [Simiduia aestuariiviva]|uniref:Zinc protease n=1 Tax=Simiduia aestuariiviva TaxID=1510459 RepID=A0A839UH40_9GAMM|nr:pitrilysin family protein [Simiduia aestuariiviva]MBB3167192.1 zinc protease [Simiduia aestuariiviva]